MRSSDEDAFTSLEDKLTSVTEHKYGYQVSSQIIDSMYLLYRL